MPIRLEEVRHVARLARLELTPQEEQEFTVELSRILDFVGVLGQLDLETVPPTSHVLHVRNVFRDDEVWESLPQSTVLANAPDSENGCFKVPRITEA